MTAQKNNSGRDTAIGCLILVALVLAAWAYFSLTGSGGNSSSPASPQPASSDQGGVRQFLPRTDPHVTGPAALTAECRDMSYTQHGTTVEVTVTFQGPGNVNVAVYPAPGEQNQTVTVGAHESGHRYVFHGVPGTVDHVQVTVTANRGVDQCYARRG